MNPELLHVNWSYTTTTSQEWLNEVVTQTDLYLSSPLSTHNSTKSSKYTIGNSELRNYADEELVYILVHERFGVRKLKHKRRRTRLKLSETDYTQVIEAPFRKEECKKKFLEDVGKRCSFLWDTEWQKSNPSSPAPRTSSTTGSNTQVFFPAFHDSDANGVTLPPFYEAEGDIVNAGSPLTLRSNNIVVIKSQSSPECSTSSNSSSESTSPYSSKKDKDPSVTQFAQTVQV